VSEELNNYNEGSALNEAYTSMVLLVDDQVLICEAVRRALSAETDIDFHYCIDPTDAVRLAEELKPTVILQDLVMPNVSGIDLLRQYRASSVTKAVPVVVLSTKDEPATKSEAFQAGANDYLVKLPDRVELIARIRYHTRAYLDHKQRDMAYAALRESQRQLMNANMELERLTRIDGLTNLGNRRYLNEYMQAELKRAVRMESALALLMIDVDHFKRYNDTYGHVAGDEVLKQVAAVIQTGAGRAGDIAARFGGEEFCVVLLEATLEEAGVVAQRLTDGVRNLAIPQNDGYVTISVGVTSITPTSATRPDDVVEIADQALFRAKAAGRNRVELAASPT
jgi:two-component system chemotaxis family response regulator WspR